MSRIIGYARVSTNQQELDRQLIALQKEKCELIYQEKITGTKKDRPELQNLLSELQSGDTVIVKELTRVARTTIDMLELVKQITDRGANIRSIDERWLDTASPSGELMLTVMAGIAQFERKLLLQRCAEGREVAKAKGTKFGRPKVGGTQLDFALELYRTQAMSLRKICENTGVAKATLCRRIKELRQDNEVKIQLGREVI